MASNSLRIQILLGAKGGKRGKRHFGGERGPHGHRGVTRSARQAKFPTISPHFASTRVVHTAFPPLLLSPSLWKVLSQLCDQPMGNGSSSTRSSSRDCSALASMAASRRLTISLLSFSFSQSRPSKICVCVSHLASTRPASIRRGKRTTKMKETIRRIRAAHLLSPNLIRDFAVLGDSTPAITRKRRQSGSKGG